jgi:formate hydrogenlyase subunit 6/NADH:ubiquinone oxidoreductase subunit I
VVANWQVWQWNICRSIFFDIIILILEQANMKNMLGIDREVYIEATDWHLLHTFKTYPCKACLQCIEPCTERAHLKRQTTQMDDYNNIQLLLDSQRLTLANASRSPAKNTKCFLQRELQYPRNPN